MEKSIWIDLSKYSGTEFEALSKMVQEHAFKLGAKWANGEKKVFLYEATFIEIVNNNEMTFSDGNCSPNNNLISVNQFLSMNKFPWNDTKKKVVIDRSENSAYEKEINKYHWTDYPRNISSIPYFSPSGYTPFYPGIIYADFSWVKGEERKILIKRAISIAHMLGYEETALPHLKDFPYFCINTKTKVFFTCSHTPKGAVEIKCNNLLEGKLK